MEKSYIFAIIAFMLLFLIIFLSVYKLELFSPYVSVLAPDIINSSPGFDIKSDPYLKRKKKSENNLFKQTHSLVLR